MRELTPYKTLHGAHRALDNGGRFYNLFAKSGDDIVDPAELAKAAGVHSSGIKAFLHFEMALLDLPSEDQKEIVSRLPPELMEKYAQQRPKMFTPSSVESRGKAGQSTIVFGYPQFVEDRTQFKGYIVKEPAATGGDHLGFPLPKAYFGFDQISEAPEPSGVISLWFEVEDIADTFNRFKDLGAKVKYPPGEKPWGAVLVALYDPEGNVFGLYQSRIRYVCRDLPQNFSCRHSEKNLYLRLMHTTLSNAHLERIIT